MKKLFFTSIAALVLQFASAQSCGTSGVSQCVPTGILNNPGFSPEAATLPPLINGDVSSTVLQFKNFDTVNFGGQRLVVQSFRFDTISNLPTGLCWATNKANNTYANQEDGCITFNGVTCATPGQYRLKMIATINVGVPIQTDMDATGLYYYLRVKNATDADTPLDTTGQLAISNIFIAYGNASDCNPTLSVSLNDHGQTFCTGSSITLNPITHGGHAPYTYNWSSTGNSLNCTTCNYPVTLLNSSNFYSVTVTDAQNASASAFALYDANIATNQMQVSLANTGIDCVHAVDTTVVTVTGGAPPYVFKWSNTVDSIIGGSPQAHTFSQAGTYVVGVIDNNRCLTSIADTIPFNGILITATQTTQPACASLATGKIKISATGGIAPYTFLWNTGGTTDSLVNVTAGNYGVTVTDASSCSFSKHFNLAPVDGWGFYVYAQGSSSTCNNNGVVNITVNGGTGPFAFNWSNGSTVQNIAGLTGGVYNVTVADAMGCTTQGQATVATSCYSTVSGTIFNDANGNCILDTGENQVQGGYVLATGNGQTYYGNTYGDGHYSIQIPSSGTFTLAASNYGYGSCGNLTLCGNANHTVTLVNIGDSSLNNNFGFTGSTGFDLNIHPGWTTGNPGFTKDYWIYSSNLSQTTFNGSAVVTFNYDPNLIYQSSTPTALHNLALHTLTWSLDSLGANVGYWWFGVNCTFLVPQNLSLGYLLQSDFSMTPTMGDCDSSNNFLHVSEVVTGSHDPNEKTVEPAGRILEQDSILTYTIGFQNTGTDSTHFIIIKDTLSTNLDASTVRNIASSHKYSNFNISGTGILTWTFNPLRLVDSFTNEPKSHGFVKFTVKKKANMPLGSVISNKAHIYFDYNEPVVTNTVADTVSEPNSIFELRSLDGISVKAFPNPFSNATNIVVDGLKEKFDFELYNVTGQLKKKLSSIETNSFQLTRDDLSSGVYFFKILSADKKKAGYGKLVVE